MHISFVFVRVGNWLLVLTLVTLLGAHWAVLQTLAWTTMLADHLQSDSLTVALVKTFDGRHPCCMCRAIAAGKKSEQKSEYTVSTIKFEYPPAGEPRGFFPPVQFERLPLANTFAPGLSSQPLTPPPRPA